MSSNAAGSRKYKRGDWIVETTRAAILNTAELDEAAARLSVPPPEICFGNNALSLRHSHFSYKFDALAALSLVDPLGNDGLQVAHAGAWAKSRNLGPQDGVKVIQKWDWTYTTLYTGDFEPDPSRSGLCFHLAPPSHPGIPLKQLASQDEPILFFEEVTLFEDELHDCGVANLVVKIRVMPSFLFVLSRFFLRVDRVLFRIFDVRLYHAFGTQEVVRDIRGREASYDAIKARLPPDQLDDLSPLTDSGWVANVLGLLEDSKPAVLHQAPTPQSLREYSATQTTTTRRADANTVYEQASHNAHRQWKGQLTRLETLKFA